MKIRSNLKQFHPSSEMKCLTKDRPDLVVIQRGYGNNSIFAIHNMTENKINYSINENFNEYLVEKNVVFKDFLSGEHYSNLNFLLEPFEVLWIGIERND